MSRRIDGLIAEIQALPESERAELRRQLARFSWWRQESSVTAAERAPASGPEGFLLVFDGGSRGNPGDGYGSYILVRERDGTERRSSLNLGSDMTSNEAEYDTLIAALSELGEWVASLGLEPGSVSVEVRGDSQLVLRQVGGQWRARDLRMADRRDRARALLRFFGRTRLVEQPREESVKLLGH